MYVKILKTSELGKKIIEIWDKAFEYDKVAFKWAQQQGAEYTRGDYFCLGGGISTAKFNGKAPKGWVKAGDKYPAGEYLISTSATGRELRKYANNLPRVTNDQFNAIIGYDWRRHTTNRRSFMPGINTGHDEYILLDFADHTIYEPIEDMVEITITEYRALKPAGKEAKDSDDE